MFTEHTKSGRNGGKGFGLAVLVQATNILSLQLTLCLSRKLEQP